MYLRHGTRLLGMEALPPPWVCLGQPHFPWSLSGLKVGFLWLWSCPVSGYLVLSPRSLTIPTRSLSTLPNVLFLSSPTFL